MAIALVALVVTLTLVPVNGEYEDVMKLMAIKSTVDGLWFSYHDMEETTDALNALIYFHATFQSDRTISVGTVMFDKVLTNNGDAYNPTTGFFQAPRDGVYVFTGRVFTRGSAVATWDLLVSDGFVLHSKSRTLGDSSNQFLSLVNLQAGDQVSVYNRDALNIFGEKHSFFSGWLIKAI